MDCGFHFSIEYSYQTFGGEMKRVTYILIFPLLLALSCRENVVEFQDEDKTGKIYLSSAPAGAEIYFENSKTGKTTPDSLTSVLPGRYQIKLHLAGYPDESVSVTVISGQKRFINVSFGYYY
ncbi:hypothetical protein C0389_02260 [bacterium]|nr:hypothetical protein [bacterium]